MSDSLWDRLFGGSNTVLPDPNSKTPPESESWVSSPLLSAGVSAGIGLLGSIYSNRAKRDQTDEARAQAVADAERKFEMEKELLKLRSELGGGGGNSAEANKIARQRLLMEALSNQGQTYMAGSGRIANQLGAVGNSIARAYARR